MLETIRSDLRLALRNLRRRPSFAAIAILTFALGIGATTAIFSVVNGVLLARLPYADRLVEVRHRNEESPQMDGRFSPQDFADLEAAGVFPQVASWWYAAGLSGANATLGESARRLAVAYADDEFFATLGAPPLQGRVFGAGEAAARERVIVLSERVWRGALNADPSVIGSTLRIDGEPFLVAGVMPASFQYPAASVDAWLPLTLLGDDDVPHIRSLRWLGAVARLAPGSDAATAQRSVTAVVERLARDHPDSNEGWTRAEVVPLHRAITGDARPALLVLLAAVTLVLLTACANVANLLLVRATERTREMAVRTALGAGRARVVRQMLTEHVVVALAGGIVGVALAYFALDALVALAGERLPRADTVSVDGTVLAVAIALSLFTGLLSGALPAWRGADVNVQSVLRESGRTGTDGPCGARLRGALVVAETALAVVLVIGATLMVRSFARLSAVDPGFDAEHVVSFGLSLPSELFGDDPVAAAERRAAYRARMFGTLRDLPGVTTVGASKTMPLEGGGEPFEFSSAPGGESDVRPEGGAMIVSAEYFRALGVPLLAGREFTERDAPPNAPALVVNAAFAERYWPGEAAVGRYLYTGDAPIEIVGVAADIRHDGVAVAAMPTVYLPSTFAPRSSQKVFVRTNGDPAAMMATIAAAMQGFDPDLPIVDLATLPQEVSATVAEPRMLTTLLGLFGGFALLLAALGMYGVIAYGVAQRTKEIGIRMALGARPRRVLGMVVGQAVGLALLGIAIGVLAAIALTRLLRSLLFEVSATDPVTFVAVPTVLLAVAACAALVPAWRAARVAPECAFRNG